MFLTKKEPKPKEIKKEKQPKEPKKPKVKRLRKRVSVLEVVSIIAVATIVGTVGFLVYKNHFRKQIPETDKELVNQLNQSVSKHFPKGGNLDLNEVIDGIDSDGIVFSRLQFADLSNELIFDSSKNTFGIFEAGKGVTYPVSIERKESKIDPTLWKFAKKNPSDKENPFSYYLLDGCSGKVTVVGGCDVGKNDDISRVAYINVIEKKQEVLIRTNSYETELMVTEDVGDTINHYGRVGKLTVNRLHTDSYHEYGDCKFAIVPSGRVVAENGGNIDVAYVLSQVAFLQENGSGKIGKAFASTERVRDYSLKVDEKYGKKKALIYDDTFPSQTDYENDVMAKGEAAQYTAVVYERIERGLENHPNAFGYTRDESGNITIFDSLKEAVEFFSDGRKGTINVTGNTSFTEPVVIKNVNLLFSGNETTHPSINGNIIIEHTNGSHKITFENIDFISTDNTKDTICDHSFAENENSINELKFTSCKFSYNSKKPSNKAAIALTLNGSYIGTKLTVEKSIFENTDENQVAITTRGVYGSEESVNRDAKVASYLKHTIYKNEFTCAKESDVPAIVTNYADITENTFTKYNTVLKLIPTKFPGNSNEFNVSVANNKFQNARYLFSLMDVDECFEKDGFEFNFYGSNSNNFNNVKYVGHFDVGTTIRYIETTLEQWTAKPWNGVLDKSIGVTLDEITMNLVTEPSNGYLTLSNGDRIKTYTQVENPVEGRKGYTIKDNQNNLYYYCTTVNSEVNIFFKENTNDAYVTLLSDGDVESLKVKELAAPVDWLDEDILEDSVTYNNLKYFDSSKKDNVGAIYKLDDVFTTINGNTYVNSLVNDTGDFIEVSKIPALEPDPLIDPLEPIEPTPVDLFVSDIGSKSKLVLTNDEPLIFNDDEYIIVLPNDSSVVISGNFDVEVKGTLKSLKLVNEMRVSITEGSTISEIVEISGAQANGLKLTNRGYISKLVLNSKAEITNYNIINKLVTGDTTNVKTKNVESMLNNAIDATIYNKDRIYDLTTYSKTRIFNKQGGHIENLTVTVVEGYEDLCAGSLILNDNTMCNADGNISLFIECTFMNESTGRIGVVSRTTPGGLIIIGDHGNSASHNKVVFINDGNIRAGQLDETHVATFVVYGVNNNVSDISPKVRIESNGIITGTTTDEEVLLVINCDIPPTIDKDIKL